MTTVATLNVEVVAQAAKLSESVQKSVVQAGDSAKGAAYGAGGKIADSINGKLLTLGKVGAVGAGAMVAGAFGTALHKGFQRLSAIDEAKARFRGLGYEGEAIEGIMGNALASVKGTAFGLGEAATVASVALASGIKPGADLERTLKIVADTATQAGTGIDYMGDVFMKAAAKGKVTGQEIQQLSGQGIAALEILAKHYGVTAEEASKMVSGGKVSFEDFQTAMETAFAGSALKSGDTFRGSLDNVNAALGRLGEKLLAPAFNAAPDLFKRLTGSIDEFTKEGGPAEQVGQKIAAALTDHLIPAAEFAIDMIGKFAGALGTAISWATEHSEGLKTAAKIITGLMLPALGLLVVQYVRATTAAIISWATQKAQAISSAAWQMTTLFFLGWGYAHMGLKAMAGGVMAAASWVKQRVAAVTNAAIIRARAIGGMIIMHARLAAFIVAQTAIIVAQWVAQKTAALVNAAIIKARAIGGMIIDYARMAAAAVAQIARVIAQWVLMRVAALTSAAVVKGQAIAGLIAQYARMAAAAVVQFARVIAGWALSAAASMASAAVMAAAWLIALGPVGWVIAAIVAVVAAIVVLWMKSEAFRDAVGAAWDWIKEKTVAAWDAVKNALSAAWGAIKGAVSNAIEGVKGFIRAGFDFVKNLITTHIGIWLAIFRTIGQIAQIAWNAVVGFVQRFRDGLSNAVGVARNIIGNIISALGSGVPAATNAGRNIIQGLWNGIQGAAGWIKSKVGSLVSNIIPGPIKKALGISSPSKVTAKLGRQTAQGLVVGLMSEAGHISGASTYLAGVATPHPAGAVVPGVAVPAGWAANSDTLTGRQPVDITVKIGDEELRTLIETEIKRLNRLESATKRMARA